MSKNVMLFRDADRVVLKQGVLYERLHNIELEGVSIKIFSTKTIISNIYIPLYKTIEYDILTDLVVNHMR